MTNIAQSQLSRLPLDRCYRPSEDAFVSSVSGGRMIGHAAFLTLAKGPLYPDHRLVCPDRKSI
jgi:hypothetical protein